MAGPSIFDRLPTFGRGAFVFTLVVVVLTAVLADRPAGVAMVLDPATVAHGQGLWQPFTALFIFPEGRVGAALFTVIVQWFVGTPLEQFWGTRRYLLLVLGAALGGYLVTTALGPLVEAVAATPVAGATPVDLAAVVAFGVVFGKRPFQLLGVVPFSARTLAAVVAAIAVLSPVMRGDPLPGVLPEVVAMVLALLATTQPWRRLSKSGKVKGRKRRIGKVSHLRVVPPTDLPN